MAKTRSKFLEQWIDEMIDGTSPIGLLRTPPPTPPTSSELSPQRPSDIAFQVGLFFVQLLDTNPEIARTYLLHLARCQPIHPDQRLKADELVRLLERHAKIHDSTDDQSGCQLGLAFGNGLSDSDREDD